MSSVQYQIKVEVTFFVDFLEQFPCHANVRITLPVDANSHGLPIHLISSSRILLGEILCAEWGYPLKDSNDRITGRYNSESLYAASWQSLQQRVDELISDTVDTLNKVIEHNKLLLITQPQSYDTVITVG